MNRFWMTCIYAMIVSGSASACESSAILPGVDSGNDSGVNRDAGDSSLRDGSPLDGSSLDGSNLDGSIVRDGGVDLDSGLDAWTHDASNMDASRNDGGSDFTDAAFPQTGWITNPSSTLCWEDDDNDRDLMWPLSNDQTNEDGHLVATILPAVSAPTRIDAIEYVLSNGSATSRCQVDFDYEVVLMKARNGAIAASPTAAGDVLQIIPVAGVTGYAEQRAYYAHLDLSTPVSLASGESLVVAIRWQSEVREDEEGDEYTYSMCVINCIEAGPVMNQDFASRSATEPYSWADNTTEFRIGGNMLVRAHTVP